MTDELEDEIKDTIEYARNQSQKIAHQIAKECLMNIMNHFTKSTIDDNPNIMIYTLGHIGAAIVSAICNCIQGYVKTYPTITMDNEEIQKCLLMLINEYIRLIPNE
jgi:hypothetical protein